MKKRTVWYLVASLIVGLALLAVSCAKVTLESISITPNSASIEVAQTKPYVATGTYSDGKTADITAGVTWKSSNTAVATVSSTGLATAMSAGTTTVTATLDTVSGTATLTVTTPPSIGMEINERYHDIHANKLQLKCNFCHTNMTETYYDPLAQVSNLADRRACLSCHKEEGAQPFYGEAWSQATVK